MSLKTRAILVVVIGMVMGLSLSIGGGLLSHEDEPDADELAWEQVRLFAEVMARVKRDYVEPIDDGLLLESAYIWPSKIVTAIYRRITAAVLSSNDLSKQPWGRGNGDAYVIEDQSNSGCRYRHGHGAQPFDWRGPFVTRGRARCR